MRFSIRDVLWLMAVVAACIGWAVNRQQLMTSRDTVSPRVNAFGEEDVPDVPEHYWFLYEPNWPFGDGATKAIQSRLPYEWIELERSGGLGPPNYVVRLQRNGSAEFNGIRNSPRDGRYQGTVPIEDYGHLCYLIERFNVEYLPPDVRIRSDHGSHGWSTIVRAKAIGNQNPFEVWEMSSNGPIELWSAQMAIDAVAEKIKWMPHGENQDAAP